MNTWALPPGETGSACGPNPYKDRVLPPLGEAAETKIGKLR